MSANASPAEIILASFSISIAAMIITGVGCSINNHIRRRRGLRGFVGSSPGLRTRRSLSRAASRKEKGLSAYEVEIYCPEVVYKGPLQTPALFWEETDEFYAPSLEEEKSRLDSPPPVASEKQIVSEDKAYGTDWFAESQSSSDADTKGVNEELLKHYFLGRHILPDGVCAVCLEVVEKDCHLRLLPCGHAFHVSCITHWLSYGNRCPLCNEMVRLSDHRRSQSASRQQLHSVRVTPSNVDSSPQTLPLFMAAGQTVGTLHSDREETESGQNPDTVSKEMVMQSFERIRLRLYERYLERQQKKSTPVAESTDTVIVMDGENLPTTSD